MWPPCRLCGWPRSNAASRVFRQGDRLHDRPCATTELLRLETVCQSVALAKQSAAASSLDGDGGVAKENPDRAGAIPVQRAGVVNVVAAEGHIVEGRIGGVAGDAAVVEHDGA